jgi:hypothetical protein
MRDKLKSLPMPEEMEDQGMEMDFDEEAVEEMESEGIDLTSISDEELQKELEDRGYMVSSKEPEEETEEIEEMPVEEDMPSY